MRQLGVLAAVRVARRQGGEVEAGRPPLGAVEEGVDLDVLELHVRGPQQDLGLAAAQRKLVRADLEQGATRPERGDREIRRDTAGECDHRPGRNVLQERCQRRDRVARERICAVQHQDEGRLAAAQRIGEAGQGLRPDGSVLERERLERPRVDRLDAVERRRHVPQKRERARCPARRSRPRRTGGRRGRPTARAASSSRNRPAPRPARAEMRRQREAGSRARCATPSWPGPAERETLDSTTSKGSRGFIRDRASCWGRTGKRLHHRVSAEAFHPSFGDPLIWRGASTVQNTTFVDQPEPIGLAPRRGGCDTCRRRKRATPRSHQQPAAQGFRFRPPLSIDAARSRDPQGRNPPCFCREVYAVRAGITPLRYPPEAGSALGLAAMGVEP